MRASLRKRPTPKRRAPLLAEHFTSEQIVEITLLAGLANLNNRFNNGLNILPEA